MSEIHALYTGLFRLEAARTEALCGLGQDSVTDARLAEADARIAQVVDALDRAGARYPLHMLAGALSFDQEDYLLLQLAMLRRRGQATVERATERLGAPDRVIRLGHAALLLGRLHDDPSRLAPALAEARAVKEGAVRLVDDGRGDPVLVPGLVVSELMGWDDD
jgi:hypothetical protein